MPENSTTTTTPLSGDVPRPELGQVVAGNMTALAWAAVVAAVASFVFLAIAFPIVVTA
jgi:hypothetical protein